MRVVLISLERWDAVWRRNQHLAAELTRAGQVSRLWFVEPLRRGPVRLAVRQERPGVSVVTPSHPVPKSLGGLALAGRQLRRLLAEADLLWVNDPALGARCLRDDLPVVYDVTDDWRTAGLPERITRRIVRAEDQLARRARTVVCSPTLHERWRQRYGVDAALVHNGVDVEWWRQAVPRALPDSGPHVGYVGTLHEQRLDLDLVVELAQCERVGTLHLVGPNCLTPSQTRRLQRSERVRVHGAVPAEDVPGWMLAMDVLVSPHLVNDFTLSLDAIKAYEYVASGRPVLATPTSGFTSGGVVRVVPARELTAAVAAVLSEERGATSRTPDLERVPSWSRRAEQFWSAVPVSGAPPPHLRCVTADEAAPGGIRAGNPR